MAQLFGVWVGASADGGEVAPHQNEMYDDVDLDELLPQRSRPADPAVRHGSRRCRARRACRWPAPRAGDRAATASASRRWRTRSAWPGSPSWGATIYPIPLAWGATFDPGLIERMAETDRRRHALGRRAPGPRAGARRRARRALGPGRRDHRRRPVPGRRRSAPPTCAGSSRPGIVATLKHFVGYSASKAGRNLAPVSVGPRELADVLLPPFEMAVRDGGARSVMHSYDDIDGVPSAADASLLTGLLRDTWGFDGTVVADYFAVGFLKSLHGVAETCGEAAAAALVGRDRRRAADRARPTSTLPSRSSAVSSTRHTSTGPCGACCARRSGSGCSTPAGRPCRRRARRRRPRRRARGSGGSARHGRPRHRRESRAGPRDRRARDRAAAQRRHAAPAAPKRIAVLGPNAGDAYAVLGCYSFPSHVGVHHPEVPIGIELPTLLDALRQEFPDSELVHVAGTTVDGGELDGIPAAVAAARDADVVVLALGDRAGLFGRGTSGEGCDAPSLELPGAQQALLDAVLASGTPTVVTLLSGPPLRAGLGGDRRGGDRADLLPRRGGHRRDRRRAQRPREPEWTPAGERPGRPRRAALELPRRTARRQELGVEHRSDSGVLVRARSELRIVRLGGSHGIRHRIRPRVAP